MLSESAERWRANESQRRFEEELKAKAPTRYEMFAGADLAKSKDATTVAIISRETSKTPSGEHVECGLKFLARMKPGRSYVDQVRALESLFSAPCFKLWGVSIFCDGTGVGEPVLDMIQERKVISVKRVQITSGDGVSQKSGRIFASRNALISGLAKSLRTEKVKISADLPLLSELVAELEGIGEERAKSGAIIYRAEGHDDLVIALALANLALIRRDSGLKTGVRPLF